MAKLHKYGPNRSVFGTTEQNNAVSDILRFKLLKRILNKL